MINRRNRMRQLEANKVQNEVKNNEVKNEEIVMNTVKETNAITKPEPEMTKKVSDSIDKAISDAIDKDANEQITMNLPKEEVKVNNTLGYKYYEKTNDTRFGLATVEAEFNGQLFAEQVGIKIDHANNKILAKVGRNNVVWAFTQFALPVIQNKELNTPAIKNLAKTFILKRLEVANYTLVVKEEMPFIHLENKDGIGFDILANHYIRGSYNNKSFAWNKNKYKAPAFISARGFNGSITPASPDERKDLETAIISRLKNEGYENFNAVWADLNKRFGAKAPIAPIVNNAPASTIAIVENPGEFHLSKAFAPFAKTVEKWVADGKPGTELELFDSMKKKGYSSKTTRVLLQYVTHLEAKAKYKEYLAKVAVATKQVQSHKGSNNATKVSNNAMIVEYSATLSMFAFSDGSIKGRINGKAFTWNATMPVAKLPVEARNILKARFGTLNALKDAVNKFISAPNYKFGMNMCKSLASAKLENQIMKYVNSNFDANVLKHITDGQADSSVAKAV